MKLLRLFLLSAASILIFLQTTTAQKSNTGNWINYFGNYQVNNKWNWHHEAQYRNYNIAGDLEQLLLRTGIGYNLSENNNNILIGYGFIRSGNYLAGGDKIYSNEHRIFQQFITKQTFNRLSLQHRYRLEERILPNTFRIRGRYFLGANVAITKKTLKPNTMYASAYNEIFLHMNAPVFDRNRLYGGVGYVLSKNIKMEVGYMSQIFENRNRSQFQVNIFNTLY